MINPIKPSDVVSAKIATMPEFVIESFNFLIAKNFDGSSSRVIQDDVVKLIEIAIECDGDEQEFDNHWLDIEPIYKQAGWEVVYDKPGYNESYRAYFVFNIKGK